MGHLGGKEKKRRSPGLGRGKLGHHSAGEGKRKVLQEVPEKGVVRAKQERPHLCPLGIVPLINGHRRGLEGGQDDVVF